jgi:deazaflavin-dependent oxidoreductase (nitroreductase family)
MALPTSLYAHGLGLLFGERLVVLVHRGRRTGAEHRTTLEPLEHRLIEGEYRVLSGWGLASDWYRNVQAAPPIELWVGSRRLRVTSRVLQPEDAAAAVRAHLLAHPFVSARIYADLWKALEAGNDALEKALTSTPVVAFRPDAEVSLRE